MVIVAVLSQHVSRASVIGMIRNTSVSHGFGAGAENRIKIDGSGGSIGADG